MKQLIQIDPRAQIKVQGTADVVVNGHRISADDDRVDIQVARELCDAFTEVDD
ncbi:MAG: hypothetical protein H0T89_22345 [Deltaproteobacteria bacterium]|nr:hypothetical protein [Deltaproteobacteria bacterium]MDQ3300679.1 hypothetical protein [Myxococcota bacterium]